MTYTHVLLDVDGTLLDYNQAAEAALQTVFERQGIPFTPEIHRLFRESSQKAKQVLEVTPAERDVFRVDRFVFLFEELGIQADAESFNMQFLSALAETPFPLNGAKTLCQTLFRLGVVLAVASNGSSWFQAKRLESAGLLPYFSHCITSEKAKAAKPDAAFFAFAWEELDNPPKNRVLMVGDSLSADVEGAKAFGFDACLYAPSGVPKGQPAYNAVKNLADIIPIVQGNHQKERIR